MKLATFTFEVMPEFEAGDCSNCIFSTYRYMDEVSYCYLRYDPWDCPLKLEEVIERIENENKRKYYNRY